MSKRLVWDQIGEKKYETGLSQGVHYTQVGDAYPKGVAWNGLTAVTESPGGAEATDLYADDIKYASLRAAETFDATIEAYTYPDEFAACDGSAEVAPGVTIGQQTRKPFGFSYKTQQGSDAAVEGEGAYKIHLIYGATASPSEKGYQTINDSPEAITFSWEVKTTPVPVPGYKPTASLVVDSTKITQAKLEALEDVIYGSESADARLPLPDEVIALVGAAG